MSWAWNELERLRMHRALEETPISSAWKDYREQLTSDLKDIEADVLRTRAQAQEGGVELPAAGSLGEYQLRKLGEPPAR